VYATCLFCRRPLGRNEVVESFPVGRRLAYDAAKGRLWVVCGACHRWNLTPLEERWEAVETCERLFRTTRLRVSTGEIGLARLPAGLELVRVGRPERPEIAAWRYGSRFSRRRRRAVLTTGAVLAGGGLLAAGGLAAGVGAVAAWQLGRLAFDVAAHGVPFGVVARIPTGPPGRHLIQVRRRHLLRTTIEAGDDGAPAFRLEHDGGNTLLTGDAARRAAALLFPVVNRAGGTPDEVRHAVDRLESAGDAERLYQALARRGPALTRVATEALEGANPFEDRSVAWHSGLLALPTSLALAVEMALNEERERRALEGELDELTRAWQEAEEIAAIADDLLLPAPVRTALERLRGATNP
jgi:hypothetical protein